MDEGFNPWDEGFGEAVLKMLDKDRPWPYIERLVVEGIEWDAQPAMVTKLRGDHQHVQPTWSRERNDA